jgi:hypothetical protein
MWLAATISSTGRSASGYERRSPSSEPSREIAAPAGGNLRAHRRAVRTNAALTTPLAGYIRSMGFLRPEVRTALPIVSMSALDMFGDAPVQLFGRFDLTVLGGQLQLVN